MDNQQLNQILDLYIKDKKSISKISEELNLSYNKVYWLLEEQNVIRKKKKFYTKDFIDNIIDLYTNKKLTKKEIASKLGLTCGKEVAKILKANNISNNKTNIEKFLELITKDELESLYIKDNLTPKEISEIFNVKMGAVVGSLKKLNITKSEELIKEVQITNSKRTFNKIYGTDYPFQNKDRLKEINEISKTKYNVKENIFQSEEIKERIKKTNLEKYGNESYTQTKEFKNKIKKSLQENYISKMTKEEAKMILSNRNELLKFLESNKNKYGIIGLSNLLGCGKIFLNNRIIFLLEDDWNSIKSKYFIRKLSKWEDEFLFKLRELYPNEEIFIQARNIVDKYELDFYFPKTKTAFEINPYYTHKKQKENEIGVDRYYHLNKKNNCEKVGINLIHVYEEDFKDLDKFFKSLEQIELIDNKYISVDKYNRKLVESEYVILEYHESGYIYNKKNFDFVILSPENENKIFLFKSGVWEVQRL